jgi:hypothetical protein
MRMGKSFCQQESKHGEGDSSNRPHQFIDIRVRASVVIGQMVDKHREYGNDFQPTPIELYGVHDYSAKNGCGFLSTAMLL